jgi:F-type H+-transporting ATPase subunit gamma
MAGISTKEIKNRIRSMESTKQITKAMEMVASSKLRHAQEQVNNARPYFDIIYDTVLGIASGSSECTSAYLTKQSKGKPVYIVIAGDRGLAGGYNSNIIKTAVECIGSQDADVFPIGRKAHDYFQSHGFNVITQQYTEAASMNVGDCFSAAKKLCQMYLFRLHF